MNLKQEIEKIIIENLKRTVPAAVKQGVSSDTLSDASTSVMGFKRIIRKGFTP